MRIDTISMMTMKALLFLLYLTDATGLIIGTPTKFAQASRAQPVVAVESWYDSGVRLPSQQAPESASPATPARETAEEAWAKAPEGSFLSPALAAGLLALGISIKIFVLEGGSPFS